MNPRVLYDEILPTITKPSRYLGTELNTVHKNRHDADLRVALVFPDLYDLGLGNLGLHVLYAILNDLPWCWAERAYAPAPDMEAALRERGLPLFALESKDPLDAMDLIGFTLQSELTYTSVLNVLDLAGLPLRSRNRDDAHPLVAAGGPTAVNPEPLAPFIDFFVVGDGEDAMVEVAQALRPLRGAPKEEKLDALAGIEGVYNPKRHPMETLAGGRVLPRPDAPKITRRVVQDLNAARFPSRYIVPFMQLVHDRVGIEVLRGCTRGCRFCQAGVTNRPARTRSLATLDALTEDVLDNTGYEEVSLLSLSTCDYPRARSLLEQTAERAHPRHVSVSLPSLRLDTFSVELAHTVAGVRRSGLTFAPEAATSRLRAVINKCYHGEELIEVARAAFRQGWRHLKLYFMIGLPTERDEDVAAIVDLCAHILERAHAIDQRARIFTGVSTFVPKPFTPFQWAAQIDLDEIRRRQRILERGFKRHRHVKYGRHAPEATFIEGLLARGDRRAADLIEAAFRKGARLESSSEHLDFSAWLEAVDDVGCDVAGAFRERALEERLPWDHIDVLVSTDWLRREWRRATDGELTPDCRAGGCEQCGVQDRAAELCDRMRAEQAPAGTEEGAPSSLPALEDPPATQRLRFRIGRCDEARFLSHLEFMNVWIRALRRARAPLAYTQGFHAHPKVTFSTAAPVGIESEGDYMDVILAQTVAPQELLGGLQDALPKGVHVYDVQEVPLKAPSLMSAVTGFDYTFHTTGDAAPLEQRIQEVLAQPTLMVERAGRPSGRRKTATPRPVDLRPMIGDLRVGDVDGERLTVEFSAVAVDTRLPKPREILEVLGLDPAATRVVKRATHLAETREG